MSYPRIFQVAAMMNQGVILPWRQLKLMPTALNTSVSRPIAGSVSAQMTPAMAGERA